ncbi:redoxin family protein [Parafilimonas terrae]|uniref:AhpC/TSA family protein n=1 Tax=Parafilimonas terrae TaxID=1465490 RepID=A0A1I5Y1I5_9BACT|nr:redoxin family protein [Parafilimonas terrae]SFQ38036.1 AhpC/TSA family protein [Parafilimonas terrae]
MIKKFISDSRRKLGALVITICFAGIVSMSFSGNYSNESMQNDKPYMKSELSSISKADAWINADGLTAEVLKGKVVLIEFCTYTCINWLRTMPYVRAWSEKYKNKGLVVIGVHTPEFPFERNIDNVRKSMQDMKIQIPVAIDNNYAIWNAFSNRYWPALYFIDVKGRIRYSKFGEGDYEESEKVILQLLKETGINDSDNDLVATEGEGIELAADLNNLASPENYLGYERMENFSSHGLVHEKPYSYTLPGYLNLNQWGVSGKWTIGKDRISLNEANGKIVYRFHSRDMHIVMGPSSPDASIRFRVLIDGKPPGQAHGIDIDEQGYGDVKEQRLYQLIRQQDTIIDRDVEIEFLNGGAEAFSVTFG